MKKFIFLILIAVLFYTRFVNLGWGLPYPMHPDERNMAVAIQGLNCNFQSPISNLKLSECLNPHFFAYGQLPLYLVYGGIHMYHFISGAPREITFNESTLALRTISALSSILLVIVLFKTIGLVLGKKHFSFGFQLLTLIFFIFQPYAIQFAHFGTTESLLVLFNVLIVYYSLKLLATNRSSLITLLLLALFSGLALGTKTSSLLFLGVPIIVFIIKMAGGTSKGYPTARTKLGPAGFRGFGVLAGEIASDGICQFIIPLFTYLSVTLIFFILSSPQSFLNWNDFISSMSYESAVGMGTYLPFYTRQFTGTVPLLFQFQHILPYVLGWPTLIGAILGFFLLPSKIGRIIYEYMRKVAVVGGLPTRADSRHAARKHWRDGEQLTESSAFLDILRFALLLSFLPPSFFFAKWTRFVAPSFPLFSLFAFLFITHLYTKWKERNTLKYILWSFFVLSLLPGVVFLSVYTSLDVRFAASKWIYKNIPSDSKILTETANVIDIPIPSPDSQEHTNNYLLNSFYFYDLDTNPQLQTALSEALDKAEYIIVPSRRIFKNHSNKSYPLLTNYYEGLFSGSMGFEKIAEFSSYPKIELFGKTLLEFPDEEAEETWTVFDHPVVRIYKKIQIPNSKNKSGQLDFSNYKTINYQLPTSHYPPITSYSLLVADTPEKWEKGLMFVKNREDIGGLNGMIFLLPDSQIRSFWNKNTLSHLTLYWINNKKVIGTSDMPSVTETGEVIVLSSPSNADTVIEIIQ